MAARYNRSANLALVAKAAPKAKPKEAASPLEAEFAIQLRELNLPEPVREFHFAATSCGFEVAPGTGLTRSQSAELKRRGLNDWRFDFAWPAWHLAIEVEGYGRHQTKAGFAADIVKYTEARLLGWTVLRFTGSQVKNGYAIRSLLRYMQREGLE